MHVIPAVGHPRGVSCPGDGFARLDQASGRNRVEDWVRRIRRGAGAGFRLRGGFGAIVICATSGIVDRCGAWGFRALGIEVRCIDRKRTHTHYIGRSSIRTTCINGFRSPRCHIDWTRNPALVIDPPRIRTGCIDGFRTLGRGIDRGWIVALNRSRISTGQINRVCASICPFDRSRNITFAIDPARITALVQALGTSTRGGRMIGRGGGRFGAGMRRAGRFSRRRGKRARLNSAFYGRTCGVGALGTAIPITRTSFGGAGDICRIRGHGLHIPTIDTAARRINRHGGRVMRIRARAGVALCILLTRWCRMGIAINRRLAPRRSTIRGRWMRISSIIR